MLSQNREPLRPGQFTQIGFYFAAGDGGKYSGGDTGGRPTLVYPQSDPWVTSLGGTSARGNTPMRVVPDIAADADLATGPLVGESTSPGAGQPPAYSEAPGGGTSTSAPLIAGMQADAQQAAGGVPIGFREPRDLCPLRHPSPSERTWDFPPLQAMTTSPGSAPRRPVTSAPTASSSSVNC